MVRLELNIKINDFIASTDSVVEVVLNNDVITLLNSKKCSYSNQLMLSEQKNHLIIRRKYAVKDAHKAGFIKQLISSTITLGLMSCAIIEPFECFCECEEEFEVSFNENVAKMDIDCSQNEGDCYPDFRIKCNECTLTSHKTLSVSDEEINNAFKERKKMITSWILLFGIVFLILATISIVLKKIATFAFSGAIFILILLCAAYSLRNLKKQCLNFKLKFNNGSL